MVLDSEIFLSENASLKGKMLTKTQVKVIIILLDDMGHAGWDITKRLGEKKAQSNLNPTLKKLKADGIILYRGTPRPSKRPHKRDGEYNEIPYFLEKSLNNIRNIIGELVETDLRETWFIFKIIADSNYLEAMRGKFRDDVNTTIEGELRKSAIFSDDFYKNLLKGDLRFRENAPDPITDEIRFWYYHTLRGIF